ncbi:hypothetical protein VTL71DRAFT_15274 [Oculimacula yallundae]|uniref:Uncharacterized protein n=1 Tax=Oculimacula yallundae TaxID=86028 RepID=A0ABR4CG36_9HELO
MQPFIRLSTRQPRISLFRTIPRTRRAPIAIIHTSPPIMSSNTSKPSYSTSTSPPPPQPSSSPTSPNKDTTSSTSPSKTTRTPLALPLHPHNADTNTTTLDMSSGSTSVKLDHLGPMVVNVDGTLSRISNWEHMAEVERENTRRVIGRRNASRLEVLRRKEAEEDGQKAEGEEGK